MKDFCFNKTMRYFVKIIIWTPFLSNWVTWQHTSLSKHIIKRGSRSAAHSYISLRWSVKHAFIRSWLNFLRISVYMPRSALTFQDIYIYIFFLFMAKTTKYLERANIYLYSATFSTSTIPRGYHYFILMIDNKRMFRISGIIKRLIANR